jgi:hypothetical protein
MNMAETGKDLVEYLKKKNEELIDKLLEEVNQRKKNQKIKKALSGNPQLSTEDEEK